MEFVIKVLCHRTTQEVIERRRFVLKSKESVVSKTAKCIIYTIY